MKKTLIASALSLSAIVASAQVVGIAKYDVANVANSGVTTQELGVGLGTTIVGLDVYGLVTNDFIRGQQTNPLGYEVGASKSFAPVYGIIPTLGVAAGRKTGNGVINYYDLTAKATMPLTEQGSVFVGYRYRDGFNYDFRSNQVSVGIEHKVSDKLVVSVAYAHTQGKTYTANGVNVVAKYSF